MQMGLGGMPNWASHAQNYYQQASGSYRGMQKKTGTEGPEKNVGGALGAGLGGAAAGTSISPGWGTVIGAGVGVIGYMLG